MAAGEAVTAVIDQLVALFNQRSLDLPDGMFTRDTQFRLNGVAFDEMLGRSPDDPLVRMLARGPAGYRLTAKAVQHAVPDGQILRGELDERAADGRVVVSGQCWLSGHYRGSGEPVEVLIGVELRLKGGQLERASVTIDPALVARLQQARTRD